MHGEHDDPTPLAPADRPWRRAPYGMGPPPEPDDAATASSAYAEPADEGPGEETTDLYGEQYAPRDPRPYAAPQPPGDEYEDGAWYGPDTSRIDVGAVAPVAGVLAAVVVVAIWAAWPADPPSAQADPPPTPTATLHYVENGDARPSGTPFFVTPTPTYTNLVGRTPTASPDPGGALIPVPSPTTGSKRKQRAQDGGDSRLSVEPARPSAEPDQEEPRTTKTTAPPSGGHDSDRGSGTSEGGSSSGNLIGRRCDELFPPSSPEFAMRNASCHQMYGSG